ncbi:MAG: ABC transporter substrate-binding protein [Fusobacteriota bacterium]
MKKITILIILFCMITFKVFSNDKKLLIIDSQSQDPYKTLRVSVLDELETLGYKKNHNLEIDYTNAGNYRGRAFNILKARLVHYQKNYDAIFLNGTIASLGSLDLIKKNDLNLGNLNIIFANVTDPIGIGLIKNFKLDNKITGVSYPIDIEKRLNFIKEIFGDNIVIGYIYSDMPQSLAYKKWLEEELKKDDFENMKIIFKKVSFVKSDAGHKRMVLLAKDIVQELDSKVDIFLSPNDQLGTSDEFGLMVFNTAKKPLVGLEEERGAALALGPNLKENGKIIASMINRVFNGESLENIKPQKSTCKIYLNEEIIKRFDIKVPKKIKEDKNIE